MSKKGFKKTHRGIPNFETIVSVLSPFKVSSLLSWDWLQHY